MMSQKKTGPENLPLKAVIALMGAVAATASVLSRLAKDPTTGFIAPSLKALGEGHSTLAIVYNVKCNVKNGHKLSFICGFTME